MGVARLSFGGCCLCGMESGGIAEFSDMGGAAALLTGRWWGDAGMARPSRGTLLPLCWRPAPGTGGRRRGAGEAMLERSAAGSSERLLFSATMGDARKAAVEEEHDALLTA